MLTGQVKGTFCSAPFESAVDSNTRLCYVVHMVRTADVIEEKEMSLIKTIARASRPLDEDLDLSKLQAVDKVQKLHERFREQWIGPSPWLVLEDGWTMPHYAPVEKTLSAMEKHGDAVGMVGIAWLPTAKRIGILQMLFRRKANKHASEMVRQSAEEAMRRLPGLLQQVNIPLKGSGKETK